MVKQISLAFVVLLLCADVVLAQRTTKAAQAAQEEDRAARKRWAEEQRADEYASSLRRRDWLKDRLVLQLGMGSKYPIMGKDWFGFGAAAEYITRWHASAFLSGGFIPASDESEFPPGNEDMPGFSLAGGLGWRLGLAYYLFPKSPLHLGFQVSYGTVYYDHKAKPNVPDSLIIAGKEYTRSILICLGWEFDMTLTYLTDEWYFLQAVVGVYTVGNGKRANGGKSDWNAGRYNPSWGRELVDGQYEYVNLVTRDADNKDAIPPVGMVFGIGIGFAFEELFPDETELRRREREAIRSSAKPGQRNPGTATPARRPAPAPSRW
ncbi:MAG: hypothetical protein FWB90_09155 [Fibromonadales bacterium]|nr:hypothetical protein [Fibromonadales bacterium]